jgi:hypothetical protein
MALATISVLGVDLGKNVCSVVGLDSSGAVVMRRKMRRETLAGLAEKLPACVVAMEACCGAHHLGRLFAAHGHDVRLMSPEYVRPYVKAHKNDDRDAEGIAEAATRPTMRFVELKSQDQLDTSSVAAAADCGRAPDAATEAAISEGEPSRPRRLISLVPRGEFDLSDLSSLISSSLLPSVSPAPRTLRVMDRTSLVDLRPSKRGARLDVGRGTTIQV